MKFVGAHVSIAGGVENAPLNAAKIGATAFAMFTKNQRQWSAPPYSETTVAAFKANCAAHGFDAGRILAHDSYLINLAQPDDGKRLSAVAAFADELRRCRQLGVKLLNFHPGSSLKLIPDDAACRLVGAGVQAALDEVPDTVAVFENTAGQGSCLGWNFDQIALMLEATARPERCGVCIDTCHAHAAGYALGDPAEFAEFWAEFDRKIGLKFLRGMHLNDAKGERGGRLDRHASLGAGTLGWPLFERVAADSRFDGIPLILETPDEALWPEEIARLRNLG